MIPREQLEEIINQLREMERTLKASALTESTPIELGKARLTAYIIQLLQVLTNNSIFQMYSSEDTISFGNFIRDNYYVDGSPKMVSYHPQKYPSASVEDIFKIWQTSKESVTDELGRDLNKVIDVANKLYYEANPTTKSDVPSYVYELIERYARQKTEVESATTLNLYEYIKMKWEEKESQIVD